MGVRCWRTGSAVPQIELEVRKTVAEDQVQASQRSELKSYSIPLGTYFSTLVLKQSTDTGYRKRLHYTW